MSASSSLRADTAFCRDILPRVSRTFARTIGLLGPRLRHPVLVSYLLCRLADTVEDSPLLSPVQKQEALRTLACIIRSQGRAPAQQAAFQIQVAGASLDFFENRLLTGADRVFHVFAALPRSRREVILSSVVIMIRGMASVTRNHAGQDAPQLETRRELMQYCYYVAGSVGQLLTGLFIQGIPSVRHRGVLEQTGIDFGRGLQLTNIVKDVRADRQRGWTYLPREWTGEEGLCGARLRAAGEARTHLGAAARYLFALPRRRYRLRLFCALPLMLAYRTLVLLGPDSEDRPIKVSRMEVRQAVLRAFCISWSNRLLRRHLDRLSRRCAAALA